MYFVRYVTVLDVQIDECSLDFNSFLEGSKFDFFWIDVDSHNKPDLLVVFYFIWH